jgi:anthranilate phosphoribosyltransferase
VDRSRLRDPGVTRAGPAWQNRVVHRLSTRGWAVAIDRAEEEIRVTGDIEDFRQLLAKVGTGASLSVEEAERAFDIMTSGDATPAQMGAFLMALRVRGETADELTGGARVLRAKVLRVQAPDDAMDIVGTGGDHHGTYNVSSCSALVVAGAGVPVAKHGNRAFTSKSGAADVLGALGVPLELPVDSIERCLREARVCFLMAPRHHSAMRNVAGPRVELAPTRTIFNLLGPLSNPALVRYQLVGVFDRRWVLPVAQALGNLGLHRALVVHGEDGLDEITTTGRTFAALLEHGTVREVEIKPEDAGLRRAQIAALKGGDAAHNAAAIRQVLDGEPSAFRDIVLLNAGAALWVAGKARDVAEGAQLAARSIDGGHAKAALHKLVSVATAAQPA